MLDGPTLGAIWLGDIVWWNDTRIEQLNNGTVLPAERILLARANDSIAGISLTWGNALSSFNPAFGALWKAGGNYPWTYLTAIEDHLTNTGIAGTAQGLHVKVLFQISQSLLLTCVAHLACSCVVSCVCMRRTRCTV